MYIYCENIEDKKDIFVCICRSCILNFDMYLIGMGIGYNVKDFGVFIYVVYGYIVKYLVVFVNE